MEEKKQISKKIVFIESDGLLRAKYAGELIRQGFDVKEICDGKEACECMQKAQKEGIFPDLVIMAIVMSGMDGFDLLEKINSHDVCTRIPKIVFTDLDNEKDRSAAFALGVDDYLIKSDTSPKDLVSAVKKRLNK
ncbi:MAG: two component LuxR family transcriptional regulator [uncultured bacterium]|nr:MAG: two component LuxR family transcriptional regulator [uncultured bacterium]